MVAHAMLTCKGYIKERQSDGLCFKWSTKSIAQIGRSGETLFSVGRGIIRNFAGSIRDVNFQEEEF